MGLGSVLEIIVAGLLFYAVGLAVMLAASRGLSRTALIQATVLLLVLLAVGSINSVFDFLPQKRASDFSFRLFEGRDAAAAATFRLQYILNLPAFLLLNSWKAAIGTNCALIALTFADARSVSRSAGMRLLAPAVLNFSLFGLRDPVLGVLLYLFVLVILRPSSKSRLVLLLVISAAMGVSRPENLLFMAAAAGVIAFVRSGAGLRVLALPAACVLGVLGLRWGLFLFGVRRRFTLLGAPAAIELFVRSRASRFTNEFGGGSNILGGRLAAFAWPIRYPLQLLTYFVLPLPFEIRNATLLLAFVDSLVFMWFARSFFRTAPLEARVVLVLYIAATSVFSSNYGNTFRIRMPAYFIMAAAAAFTERTASAREAQSSRAAPPRQLAGVAS